MREKKQKNIKELAKPADTKHKIKQNVAQLEQQLKEKDALLQGCINDLQRIQAEFENYMKRTEKEKVDLIKFGRSTILQKLIGFADVFEKAIQAGKNAEKEKILEGIEMMFKQLTKTLEEEGVKPMETIGKKFDPHSMEVVAQKDGNKPGIVLENFQKGYLFEDKVLRAAKVIIVKEE